MSTGNGDSPQGFIDAHMHLHDTALQAALQQPEDRDSRPDIAVQVVNGTHPADWPAVRDLEDDGPLRRLKAYGVHPWKVDDLPEDWEATLKKFLDTGAVSVGEIGLDHWIEPRDEEKQVAVFEKQLQIAADRGLAPTIHCLRCWGLLHDILRAGPDLPKGFLVHGFGGSKEMLYQLIDLGGYASFSAYAADPGRKRMRDAARACPADRLLVETDAPDMVPPEDTCRYPLKDDEGKRLHHPHEIETAYAFLSQWRGEDPEQLAAQVRENFARVMGKGE